MIVGCHPVRDSRIVHEIIQSLIAESGLNICEARLNTLRVVDNQTESLDPEFGQVGNGSCFSGRSQHAQSIPVEFARKGVSNSPRGAAVVISSRSWYLDGRGSHPVINTLLRESVIPGMITE